MKEEGRRRSGRAGLRRNWFDALSLPVIIHLLHCNTPRHHVAASSSPSTTAMGRRTQLAHAQPYQGGLQHP